MALSVQTICKNTFISFVAECACTDDSIPASLKSASRWPRRSHSAESFRSRPEAEEFQELPKQSLQRLNAVLSVGISSPLQAPQKGCPELGGEFMLDQPENLKEAGAGECRPGALSDLRMLQGRLGKALVTNSSPKLLPQKPLDLPSGTFWHVRNISTCSLSTMAPDDASECGESSRGGLGMRHVWSSGSVSTMVSDINESFAEDNDVEFELDIEAGAAAALKEKATVVPESVAPVSANTCPGAVSPDMIHSTVPKNHNLAEMYNKDETPTTMMIRNVPGRYSQNDLMMDLQDLGFAGTYDFLYIPMDKGTAANVGYAFINFVDHNYAKMCMESFEGYRFTRHQRSSKKVATVSVAHLQGLEKNMQHYEKAAVNCSRDKRRRPVVLPNIASVVPSNVASNVATNPHRNDVPVMVPVMMPVMLATFH